MLRRNVVLIKNRRNTFSKLKRGKLTAYLRTLYMTSLIITCIIGLLFLFIMVDEQSQQIGFGIYENAIDIYEIDTNYVMRFFSKKVEIPVDKAKETINTVTDFSVCLIPPIIRAIFQGVMISIT